MKFKEEVDLAIQKMNRLYEEMKIEEKEINEIEEMKVNDLLYDFDTFYFVSASLQVYVRYFRMWMACRDCWRASYRSQRRRRFVNAISAYVRW